MARHPRWSDEYWPQLLQVYLEKPVGVKPLYAKRMVDLSLEWHIPPQYLHKQMFQLRLLTPSMERLWATYGDNPKKLKKDITTLRKMRGLGNAELFYEGVEVNKAHDHSRGNGSISNMRPLPEPRRGVLQPIASRLRPDMETLRQRASRQALHAGHPTQGILHQVTWHKNSYRRKSKSCNCNSGSRHSNYCK